MSKHITAAATYFRERESDVYRWCSGPSRHPDHSGLHQGGREHRKFMTATSKSGRGRACHSSDLLLRGGERVMASVRRWSLHWRRTGAFRCPQCRRHCVFRPTWPPPLPRSTPQPDLGVIIGQGRASRVFEILNKRDMMDGYGTSRTGGEGGDPLEAVPFICGRSAVLKKSRANEPGQKWHCGPDGSRQIDHGGLVPRFMIHRGQVPGRWGRRS